MIFCIVFILIITVPLLTALPIACLCMLNKTLRNWFFNKVDKKTEKVLKTFDSKEKAV